MFGLAIPFAIETTRRNPVRTSVRNLAMSQGDDLILAIQVYAPDGSAVDITDADVTVAVQREFWGHPGGAYCHDYEFGGITLAEPVVWTGVGAVTSGPSGQATVTVPSIVTSAWWGRFRLRIALTGTVAGCVTAEGVLDVRRAPPRPIFVPPPNSITVDFLSADFLATDFLTDGAVPPVVIPSVVVPVLDDSALILVAG